MKPLLLCCLLISNYAFSEICQEWSAPQKVGQHTKKLNEISGLCHSKMKKDYYIWANDSGGAAALYASKEDGKVTRTVTLKGFSNWDYEAVEQGPCPRNTLESCIFVADIGNNLRIRPKSKIGVFKESDFWTKDSISPIHVMKFRTFKNYEAVIVNDQGNIILLSKSKSGVSELFNLDFKSTEDKVAKLGQIIINNLLQNTDSASNVITDASYSPSNKTVLLLTYGNIIEVNSDVFFSFIDSGQWVKGRDYNIIKSLPLSQLPQKETITYMSDSRSFITSSESESDSAPLPLIVSHICN